MTYNLYDLGGYEWQARTLDGARKKAYSLIDVAPYRTSVFIYNGTRYLGTVQLFRTTEDSKRNIYKEHIVYASGTNVWGLYSDGTTYRIPIGEEDRLFVGKLVADARRTFHSKYEIKKR